MTSGATEAITACLMAVLDPGDEVVLIEPLYDTYLPMVRLLGATPARGAAGAAEMGAAARRARRRVRAKRTKAILLNTPMNPTGKVFTAAELAFIAELVQKHDAYAICDEVYEHLTYDGWRHIPLMSLPGMRERTMRIGSAGKTFSLTGWKVGYVTACAALCGIVAKAHQNLTFTTPPNLQRAVAIGLGKEDAYFEEFAAGLAGEARPADGGARRARHDRAAGAGELLRQCRFRAARLRRRRCRLLPPHHRGRRRDRDPALRLLRRRPAAPLRALRLLQARSGARRGGGAARPPFPGRRGHVDGDRLSGLEERRCGGRSSVGRAPGCGLGCRGFESHRSPQQLQFRQGGAGAMAKHSARMLLISGLTLPNFALLGGCGQPSAARAIALNAAIGQSEAALVRGLGTPAELRVAGDTRMLTYRRTDPLSPPEPDPSASPLLDAAGSAFDYPPEATLGACATTFDVVAGQVVAWHTRGDAC